MFISCCLLVLYLLLSVSLIRSCSELLFGCSKLKTKDFIPILRIYGFEGEAGREGGVFTRIY